MGRGKTRAFHRGLTLRTHHASLQRRRTGHGQDKCAWGPRGAGQVFPTPGNRAVSGTRIPNRASREGGGLAHVVVVAEIFLSGITGSAVADTAAIGRILIPSMKEEGYDVDFAAAITAAAGILGPIIPPSIVMVVYAAVMQTSVAALFAAGIVPGLVMAVGLMALSYSISKTRGYSVRGQRASGTEVLRAAKRAVIPLMM